MKRSRVAAALLLVLGTAPGTLVRTSTPIENAGPLLAEPLTIPQSAEQSGVVFDAGFALVALLLGVLIGGVGGDSGRDVLGDQFVDAIGVGPRDVAELVVERLENVLDSGIYS